MCVYLHVSILVLSLYVLYVIALDGALACSRGGGAGQEWWWSVFNDHQGPPTCTRNPTQQHSDALDLTPPRPHFTSTLFSRVRPSCTAAACHLSTPQAATTSANRKRDAPSPKPSIWACRALLRRPPASTGLELNRNPDCCSSQTSPLSTSIRKFVLLSQRLSAATKRQRHSSLRPQLY